MCAIFGFLDYGHIVSNRVLKKLLRELSIAAECRGKDATGMSYVKHGKIVTFKKAKPAHKVKMYFPRSTAAVIGHTRFTTQGSEKHNYNNHPFEGNVNGHHFALAHNGVLYNDVKLRRELSLPDTRIETDSYMAVQLLEQQGAVDEQSLQHMLVINNLSQLGFGPVNIVNLYRRISTKLALRFNSDEDLLHEENDTVIAQYAAMSDAIIIAWGSAGVTSQRVRDRQNDLLNTLSRFENKMYQIGKEGYHPLTPVTRNSWVLVPYKAEVK